MAVTGIAESRGILPPHVERLTDAAFSEELEVTLHVAASGKAAIADVRLPNRSLTGWDMAHCRFWDGSAFISGRVTVSHVHDVAFFGTWSVGLDGLQCVRADAALLDNGEACCRYMDAATARRRFTLAYARGRTHLF